MRLSRTIALAALLILGFSGSAQADWWEKFWGRVKLDWHRNNAWPDTFTPADRAAVEAPFAVMIHNGWREQNTLGDYYFDVGQSELNEAGRLRVKWIMTEAPEQYRSMFVERAESPELTTARMASVRMAASAFLPPGGQAEVYETLIPARGWPAEDIYSTYVKFRDSRPAPVLPEASGEEND
jgi:hypothetical protein